MNIITQGDFDGHGLFMTAEGRLAVLRPILPNIGQILMSETVEMMFENQQCK